MKKYYMNTNLNNFIVERLHDSQIIFVNLSNNSLWKIYQLMTKFINQNSVDELSVI